MKTNIFKSSIMAVAMIASFSACTQDELGTEATTGEDTLNVIAYSNDFVSSDTESRVTNTDYTTSFDEGDAIGIFVVRNGQALVSNMKMTLGSDGAWKGENNSPLYYYKDADYIAYYPYTEGLKAISESDIVAHFTEKIGTSGQATKAEYEAADLMSADVKATDVIRGENITFNFTHKMSMIEVKVPVRYYTTEGGYSYKAPLGLQVNSDNNNLALCCIGSDETNDKDIYRCILAPSETVMQIDGQFQDGATEVYFPKDGTKIDLTLLAGHYKGININYAYEGGSNETRNLQPGDYFYADGSIYPKELRNAPSVGCIGIIFSTDVQEEELTNLEYNHGYVVAIVGQDVDRKYDGNGKRNWSSSNGLINTETTIENCFGDRDAYSKFSKMLENNISVALDTKEFGTTENTLKYAAPLKSSGWMLPTTGLIIDIFNNLSDVQKDGEKWVLTNSNAGKGQDSTDQDQKVEMINDLKAIFDGVGGGFICEEAIKGKNPNVSEWWWSSTEEDATDAYIIEFKTNGQSKLLDRQKTGNNGVIRPIFAF